MSLKSYVEVKRSMDGRWDDWNFEEFSSNETPLEYLKKNLRLIGAEADWNAFLPYKYGDNDGCSGPPVNNPLVVYLTADLDCNNAPLLSIDVAQMIEDFAKEIIDWHGYEDGDFDEKGRSEILTSLEVMRQFLAKLVIKIEEQHQVVLNATVKNYSSK